MRARFMIFAIVPIMTSVASANPSESGGIESLGHELLEGLKQETLRQPEDQPPANANRSAPTAGAPLAAPRFDDLGEDLGQQSGPLALARVRHGMQHAASLLGNAPRSIAGGTESATPADVQQQVLRQLDELIAELSKQCQGGQCQPGDQPQPSSQSQPSGTGAAGRGQTAARDSTTRLDQSNAPAADKADIEELVKGLWGHLPERSREQMLQSFSDEFLPKYELEIEQYYESLSNPDEKRLPQ
jgi:hypothetical protein